MGCTHIYDFIHGTKMPLPTLIQSRMGDDEYFDILRPSQRAEHLLRQHIEKLEAFKLIDAPVS